MMASAREMHLQNDMSAIVCLLLAVAASTVAATNRPVIGIMTEPCPDEWQPACGNSFVNADYVKWLQAAGARF
jgi:hypothetical protein